MAFPQGLRLLAVNSSGSSPCTSPQNPRQQVGEHSFLSSPSPAKTLAKMSYTPEDHEKHAATSVIASSDMSEKQKQQAYAGADGVPEFTVSSLWRAPVLNPLNLKSYTLPIFNLNNPYSRNFHLSWLGFFVAFLSWFAFPPLIPEAIRADLKLTTAQVGNSNIVSLVATLFVRIICGPLVDRYGPRKVMAGVLILGAIPSGLAGTVTTAGGLYTVRFFIGILGGTFVPCQAWTTLFFDKTIVGRANALVGGWGNSGGGVTFIVMTNLYAGLIRAGLTRHVAWRASFAIIPVPILLITAALTLIFGTDCPAGKWEDRHNVPATALAVARGHQTHFSKNEHMTKKDVEGGGTSTVVAAAGDDEQIANTAEVDVAVNETLTFKTALKVLASPQTWLPSLSYFTSFGLELAIDGNFANILFAMYQTAPQHYSQVTAGYLTAVFGLMNIVTRPLGGYAGDVIYRKYGVPGKKWLMLTVAFINGAMALALGLYIQMNYHAKAPVHKPAVGSIMAIYVIFACFNEAANGVNFSLVPHLNSYNNGVMSGLVGAVGNFGGVIFAIIFRYIPMPQGKAIWVSGIVVMVINASLTWIPVPKR